MTQRHQFVSDLSFPTRVALRLLNNRSLMGRKPYYAKRDNGCWEWIRGTTPAGYGKIMWRDEDGRATGMVGHRCMYELMRGPIPQGLDLDHLCRNRPCINPDHLEPVTRKENVRRGVGNGSQTHCPHGHEYTPDNIYWTNLGHRICKTCRKKYSLERHYRLRDERLNA